jgi:hypothetical protein
VTSIGEHVQHDRNGEETDSPPLTVKMDTPDGQPAETTFDHAKVKYDRSRPWLMFDGLRHSAIGEEKLTPDRKSLRGLMFTSSGIA